MDEARLPDALAHYLLDRGLRTLVRAGDAALISLPSEFPAPLLAAVVEAATAYPTVSIQIGDRVLTPTVRWEIRRDLFRSPPARLAHTDIIGESVAMGDVLRKVQLYAQLPYPVLVLGETGTGKELVAKRLHEESGRSGPFMPTNAGRLSPELAESLLFGHVEGAFTGANEDRIGRMREAEGGTFFLDEIFGLHPSVQGKLLRALNNTERGVLDVEPLGSSQKTTVHARLVVASQKDPRSGRGEDDHAMREDYYYRVAAGVIRIPPLRHRPDDIAPLARHLLADLPGTLPLSDAALDRLAEHTWPGNVRELRLVLLRALIHATPTSDVLDEPDVTRALAQAALPVDNDAPLRLPCRLQLELKRLEVATLRAAQQAAGTSTDAGRAVGMKSPRNFTKRLAQAESRLAQMEESNDGR